MKKINIKKAIIFILFCSLILFFINKSIYNQITSKTYFYNTNNDKIELLNNIYKNLELYKQNNFTFPIEVNQKLLLKGLLHDNIYNIKLKDNIEIWNKEGFYSLSTDRKCFIIGMKVYKDYIKDTYGSGVLVNDYYYMSNSYNCLIDFQTKQK